MGNVILPFTQMGMCYTGKTERKTIFPLHSCKDYQYMDVKEDRSIMNEEFFDNENWYIRLLMEATDRMEINQTKVASNHRIISYSDFVDDRTILVDPSSDILDQYIEKEMLYDLLDCLTARQKEIIQLFYFEENELKAQDCGLSWNQTAGVFVK